MTRRGNVEKIILDFAKAVCEGERTMIDEKKVELMKKLQRLAERGVGGEKEGAQKKLQDDIEMSDEDAMRMQMAMSAMKDKSMTQRIEG